MTLYYKPEPSSLPFYQIEVAGDPVVSLADMKHALKANDCDDDFIQALLNASTQAVEKYMNGRQIRNNHWHQFLDCFAERIRFDKVPFVLVDVIDYLVDGVWTTVDPTIYYTKHSTQWGEVILEDGESWPTDGDDREHSVRVSIRCKALECIDLVRAGIRMHVTFMYENRGDSLDGNETDSLVASGAQGLIQRAGIKNV